MQYEDEKIGSVMKLKKKYHLELPKKERILQASEVEKLLQHWPKLKIEDDLSLIMSPFGNKFVLPSKLKNLTYKELHSEKGHLGPESVFQLAREREFWPGLEEEVSHHIQKVCSCVKKKAPHQKNVAPLSNITTTRPLEIIGVDFFHPDTCSGAYEYVPVVTDHITKYA